MKNKTRHFITAGLVTCIIGISIVCVNAASTMQPGSVEDPLVSKSYVDEQVSQIFMILNQTNSQGGNVAIPSENNSAGNADNYDLEERIARLELLYQEGLKDTNAGTNANTNTNAQLQNAMYFEPVSASKGQTVLGREGSEIILRSGKAVGFCPGENGILDATSGVEIFSNSTIQINHLIIVPRADGRGVQVTEDAWFIIKGGYDIK